MYHVLKPSTLCILWLISFTGVINVDRFKSKLTKYRVKSQAMGIKTFKSTGTNLLKAAAQYDSDEEKDEFMNSVKDIKDVKPVDEVEDEDVHRNAFEETGDENADDVRMQQLEAMMLDMAQRERELTMALIKSQARAAQLTEQVDNRGRVAKDR
jgi:hypothetical protein